MVENKRRPTKRERRKGNATIVEVAERAGVSIKTVSRVINSEANVRESTRAKVWEAARALDYTPNPSARGLAGNRSFSVGMLYNNPTEFGYVKDNLFGAYTACRDLGYSLVLHPYDAKPELNDVKRFVSQTGIDGLILAAPVCDEPDLLAMLDQMGLPYVQIQPTHTADGAVSVQCDDYEASFALTEYVIGLGHRRIGFIKGDPGHASSKRRYAGFRACLKAQGVRYERALTRQGYFDFDSGRACARKLLNLPSPPSAIIASNDDMAAGVLFAAHEGGIAVPDELSVTGFDNTLTARHCWPPLTTVHQPIIEMSHGAAELLVRRLNDKSDGASEHIFACELVYRESTGPVAT